MRYLYILYIDQIISGTIEEHHASKASDDLNDLMYYVDNLPGYTITEWIVNGDVDFRCRYCRKGGIDIKIHIQRVDWV